jgi:hypothetical protein
MCGKGKCGGKNHFALASRRAALNGKRRSHALFISSLHESFAHGKSQWTQSQLKFARKKCNYFAVIQIPGNSSMQHLKVVMSMAPHGSMIASGVRKFFAGSLMKRIRLMTWRSSRDEITADHHLQFTSIECCCSLQPTGAFCRLLKIVDSTLVKFGGEQTCQERSAIITESSGI